jgi:molybdenum cofactor cytidylyltransferase
VQPCFVSETEHGSSEQRGHPVGFGAVCQQDLLNLRGNKGAASVIAAYEAMKLIVKDVGIVTDIDTVGDLSKAESLLENCSFTINTGF